LNQRPAAYSALNAPAVSLRTIREMALGYQDGHFKCRPHPHILSTSFQNLDVGAESTISPAAPVLSQEPLLRLRSSLLGQIRSIQRLRELGNIYDKQRPWLHKSAKDRKSTHQEPISCRISTITTTNRGCAGRNRPHVSLCGGMAHRLRIARYRNV
jgi:hypothetical protein